MTAFIVRSCAPKASNAIEELSKDVLKSKEGIDIRLIPIEEEKPQKK